MEFHFQMILCGNSQHLSVRVWSPTRMMPFHEQPWRLLWIMCACMCVSLVAADSHKTPVSVILLDPHDTDHHHLFTPLPNLNLHLVYVFQLVNDLPFLVHLSPCVPLFGCHFVGLSIVPFFLVILPLCLLDFAFVLDFGFWPQHLPDLFAYLYRFLVLMVFCHNIP